MTPNMEQERSRGQQSLKHVQCFLLRIPQITSVKIAAVASTADKYMTPTNLVSGAHACQGMSICEQKPILVLTTGDH